MAGRKPFETRLRKTPFIHKMDRTPTGVVCPPYYVLSHSNGCPFRCDYCCLQLPLSRIDVPVIFENEERMLAEVRKFLADGSGKLLSAGESSDSLAFDPFTKLSGKLVTLFSRQDEDKLFPKEKPHKLLFVTKSANVKELLAVTERANVVLSFSLNAPEVAARYEHGAPHPFKRLEAAKRCQDAGYEVRIRIDPIIPISGWRKYYGPLLERIASELRCEGLRFTLGTIRHNPGLRRCVEERGRNTEVFSTATSREGTDGRFRVPPALRVELYCWMREQLPKRVSIALCKETETVWRELGLDLSIQKCNCMT